MDNPSACTKKNGRCTPLRIFRLYYKIRCKFFHLLYFSPSHLLMYFFPFCITMPFASLLTRWPARL